MNRLLTSSLFSGIFVLLVCSLSGAGWPMYRADPSRSGATDEHLKFPLTRVWTHRPAHAPRPAWPEPGKELNRMDFDTAFQPVAADGMVCFASSADDTVRALDPETGALKWRFIADGPVRFAPALARGRVYFAADDGYVYCLDARTGKQRWRVRPAAERDRIMGNGRLIARYPCRSGVLVVGDTLYVTAGMWPTEGVYVCALDADTGTERWCNDSSGNIFIDLPHAVANGFSGVAPQGYLVASGDVLLVPTGRSVPAAFDRLTGRLLYYKPEKTHYHGAPYGGGVWCAAAGDVYFHPNNRFTNPSEAHTGEAEPGPQDGMIVYSFTTGDQISHIPGKHRVLAAGEWVYCAGQGNIRAVKKDLLTRKRRILPGDAAWTTDHADRVYCLALAGNVLITGNRDSIRAFRTGDGNPLWEARLPGRQIRGLAVADGRLIAAAQTGEIICFAAEAAGPGTVVAEGRSAVAGGPAEFAARAADLIRETGKTKGYALVVGEPDSRLAMALAAQTDLHVINPFSHPSRAARERQRLADAGLLGVRAAVPDSDSSLASLPPYFADLVVVSAASPGVPPAACYRSLRPHGGVLRLIGFDAESARRFLAATGAPAAERTKAGDTIIRGRLPGSGEWRYPWADGGRSGIGDESRIRFPLQLLWFGGSGPGRLLDRHLMPSPPVAANGRVFVQGQHHVLAFDAYTGRELWSEEIRDVGRKYAQYYSSSLVADDDSVYVVQADRCRRLDQNSGTVRAEYPIPPAVLARVPPPAVAKYVEVEWPRAWQVIGPFPKNERPLTREQLEEIPRSVVLKGKEYLPAEIRATGDVIDLTTLFGGYDLAAPAPEGKGKAHPRRGKRFSYRDVGRTCYAFAKITCPSAGKLLIGAGADWGMLWFLDGEPVFDALRNDSSAARSGYFRPRPCSTLDELFDVEVTGGEHTLAVLVTAGGRGWALASACLSGRAERAMPVATGANPNVPNLRDLSWGYLSVTDELILGSFTVPVAPGQPAESHLLWRSESKAVFALDKKDGSLRWQYRPRPGRVVGNIEIAFGDGRLFLIDGTSKADLVRARRRRRSVAAELTLVALNVADGSELWRQDDVPLLGDRSMFSRLKSNVTHLFMGQPSWGHLTYRDGVVVYGINAAYDAATGRKLWAKTARPGKLPVIYEDRIITGSFAYDLRTGTQRMTRDLLTGAEVPWRYEKSYGCGPVAGCRNVLFFRSGADGFFDMITEGTTNFGGVRSGCARTLLAAGGLLIHPQGYSGCPCSYNYKTNLALVSARPPGDTWYVLPQRANSGPIRRIGLNFGAPGDRKDGRGLAWLGFPRPLTARACPAPVSLSMQDAAGYYRRRKTARIEGTDIPWIYGSGLRGRGRITIDLALQPGVPLSRRPDSPAIDGAMSEPCWADVRPVPFRSSAFSLLGAGIDFRLFRDAENLYFGYRRGPLSSPPRGVDSARLQAGDELQVFLADRKQRTGILLTIRRYGSARTSFGTVGVSRKTDPGWQGVWRYAVRQEADGWGAEIALPIATLTAAGMALERLRLNCMSLNLTGSGLEGVFLTDPLYGVKFRCCSRFLPLVRAPAAVPPERRFTVRLHFAETAASAPGERVFDVRIQDRPALTALDVIREAGGPNRALTREFTGVTARDRLSIDLIPEAPVRNPNRLPILSAVEVEEEG